MKNVNFHSIKNLTAPESWVKNALEIPEKYKQEKKTPILSFRKTAYAVAALMLAVSLSLSVLAFINSGTSLPVAPTNPTTPSSTDTVIQTGSTVVSQSTGTADKATTSATESSEPTLPVVTTDPSESIDSTENTLPTQKPTETPTEPKPTTTDREENPTKPTKATEPTYFYPTYPTIPPTETTTEGGIWVTGVSCDAKFSEKLLTGSGRVYCKMFNSKGIQIGDPFLFSPEHEAHTTVVNGTVYASYFPEEKGLALENDEYTFSFYNESGEILSSGSLKI